MKTQDSPQQDNPPSTHENELSEKYPEYKYYQFPDGTIYFGETVTISKEGKIIEHPEQITDEEQKKTLSTVRHGYGIQFYEYKDGKYTSKYDGNWYFDKKKGKGKANYSDESYYDGEFDNDLYDGTGKLFWKQGYVYIGKWTQGRMDGEGEFRHYDGHVLKGLFANNYYLNRETGAFINPFLTSEEVDNFKVKNFDFREKSNQNKFEKFSRENLIRITNELELFSAIDDTYKSNKIPLILRSLEKQVSKDEVFELFSGNYKEIDLRYCYMKLHESSLGINISVFDEIKQNVIEAMTRGLFLILNFDDCKEQYKFQYDADIREFYGNMMLSKYMWDPSLFFSPKCSSAHLNNRSDLKFDKNFKFICYSKFLIDEKIPEHDLLNEIEKRFEKCFPLVNMNVLIYSAKKQIG